MWYYIASSSTVVLMQVLVNEVAPLLRVVVVEVEQYK